MNIFEGKEVLKWLEPKKLSFFWRENFLEDFEDFLWKALPNNTNFSGGFHKNLPLGRHVAATWLP